MPVEVTSWLKNSVPRVFQVGLLLEALVDAAPTMALPGATRSGLSRLSMWRTPRLSVQPLRVGPRELNMLTVSSLRAAVPLVLAEPTVITDGSLPGALMVPKFSWPSRFLPKLPAATTTVIPAALALRTAAHSGSVCQLSVEAAARLRFITRMLYSLAW